MAMETTESDKQMFTNWSQSSLCLEMTKTALHKWVIQNWKQLLHGYNDSTMRQFLKDFRTVSPKYEVECSHHECKTILSDLLKQERKPGCFVHNRTLQDHICRVLSKKRDELSKEKYIWCLANMFMQSGKGQTAIIADGPENTDVSLFFKMMKDCKLFEFQGCDELYENILEVRKEIHHSATYLFTKDQKLNCLNRMIRLLEAFPTEESCRSAISQINEMERRPMSITSISEKDFKTNAKNALKLQEKSLVAEIQTDKVKGYATVIKEQRLKDTEKALNNLDGHATSFGLETRKELKKENQELMEKVKFEKLRKQILNLKIEVQKIEDPNLSDSNRCGIPLGNAVQYMRRKLIGPSRTYALDPRSEYL